MPTEFNITATPIGDLEYIVVRGEPQDFDGDKKFKWKADVVLTAEAAEGLLAKQEELLANNLEYDKEEHDRPTKCLVPYVYTKKHADGKKEKVKVKGKFKLKARTNAYFKDNLTVVTLFNPNGSIVDSTVNDIGNGSTGRLQGTMKYYKMNDNSWGVAFYLKGVQVKEKIVRTDGGGEAMGAIEGFEGMADVNTPEID